MEKHKPISCLTILLSPEVPEKRLWVMVCPQHMATLNGKTSGNKEASGTLSDESDASLIINQGILPCNYLQSKKGRYREANLLLRYFTNQNFTN